MNRVSYKFTRCPKTLLGVPQLSKLSQQLDDLIVCFYNRFNTNCRKEEEIVDAYKYGCEWWKDDWL